MIKKVAFYTFSPTISALEHYRVYSPLVHAGIEVLEGVKQGQTNLAIISESDLVLFQRDFANHFEAYQDVIQEARKLNKPVVLDLDDDLLSLPRDHPDRVATYYASGLPSILHAILNADGITVTTKALKQSVLKMNPNVWVLPNYLDESLWQMRSQPKSGPNQPLTILYMGTTTHRPDLQLVSEALLRITKTYRGAVRFLFYGIEPPGELAKNAAVSHQPVLTYDYKNFVSLMGHLRADLAIAPLCDNDFNHSKSALKYLEYSAMGIPAVYSRISPYSDVIEDGSDGMLAATPEEWFEKTELLIRDANLRQQIVKNAQAKVQQRWLMREHGAEWQSVYEQIKPTAASSSLDRASLLHSLWKIVIQLEEFRAKQERTINELNDKSAALMHQLGVVKAQKEAFEAQDRQISAQVASLMEQKEASVAQLDQLNAQLNQLGAQVTTLKAQKEASDAQVKQLGATLEQTQLEVVDYALSTSWKITRPLRKISKKLRRDG